MWVRAFNVAEATIGEDIPGTFGQSAIDIESVSFPGIGRASRAKSLRVKCQWTGVLEGTGVRV